LIAHDVDAQSTARAPELPPRPQLSRWAMRAGFVLNPTKFLDDCRRTTGDYFTLRPAPGRTMVFTADPDAVRQVFTGDPALLHAGEANIILAPLLGMRSVLLLDGPEHMRQRKLMLPPFHGERMRTYERTMEEAAQWHVAGWPRGRPFAALASLQAITLDVIMRTVFGIEDHYRAERLTRALRAILDMTGSRLVVLRLLLSSRGDIGRPPERGAWGEIMEARRRADALIYEQIAARRADAARSSRRTDVLSLLLAARDEDGNGLTDQELRDELMTLLVAGHETTATAMGWALERIVRHEDVLERLTDDYSDDYLDAVVKETLRLRPVVPAVARTLQQPMEFGGWLLPAGVNIAPSIYLLHRREDLYPEPTAFRPERFLGRTPGTYEWIPFGGGTRRCLGASFALMEMRVVLRTILRAVKLQATSGSADESVARRAVTFAPGRGARIAVSRS
jgi:cytochrome P450